MTTVATRIEHIIELEQFPGLMVERNGKPLPPSEHGVLGLYPYDKAAPGRWTVQEWTEKRFAPNHEGFTCYVLFGTGDVAADSSTLDEVRASYFGE